MRCEVGPGHALRFGASGVLRNSKWAGECTRRAAWTESLLNAAVHVRSVQGEAGVLGDLRSPVYYAATIDIEYSFIYHNNACSVSFVLYYPSFFVPSMNLIQGIPWVYCISLQRACLTSLARRVAWERSCRLLIKGKCSLQLPLLRNVRPVPAQYKVGPAAFTHYGFRVVICRFLLANIDS